MKFKKLFLYIILVNLICSFINCEFSTEPKYKIKRELAYKYADEYWSENKWKNWFFNLTEDEQAMLAHGSAFVQGYFKKNTRVYYITIMKYDDFLVGWADVPDNLTFDEIFNRDPKYNSLHRIKCIELWIDAGLY